MFASPAADSLESDFATESPEMVCREFILRLQNGDRIGAENLLTRVALTTTQRANLKLEPISSQDATTEILPARYVGHLNRTAEVDCVITETDDGHLGQMSLTWQVVRQSNGWRVCGMSVPLDNSNDYQLLSFESIDDVATIKALAAGAAILETQRLRQADANENNTSLQ